MNTKLERRADGFLHRRIDVGEVDLHVAEARPAGIAEASDVPGNVPLVVFLHGFPSFWWCWHRQLPAMAKAGFWAVAPDLRGYAESDKPGRVADYRVDKLAADVAGLIRALGRSEAIVVGHDWGAMVAWALASQRPEVVQRLAILNVPHLHVMLRGLLHPSQLRRSWYIFFFQLPRVPEELLSRNDFALLRRAYRAEGFGDAEVERYVDAFRAPGALRGAIAYYRAVARSVLSPRTGGARMGSFEKPVLVIWGDRDRVLRKELAEPPPKLVPNARVVHVPEANHWVHHQAAELVNERLIDFVEGASRAEPG